MSYKLFLDDERFPPTIDHEWVICRTQAEFEGKILTLGVPSVISFDHDLGGESTGLQCLKWFIEMYLDGFIFDIHRLKRVIVHSMNPVGAQNIKSLWDCFASGFKIFVKAE